MNILPLPEKFDLNEWCAIGLIIICLIIIYYLPKKFKASVVLVIWLFNINLVMLADFTLGVKPFNFYDFMDQPKLELVYNLSYFTLYPGVAYLVLYFYDFYKFKKTVTLFYLLIVSSVLVTLEWIALKVQIIEYVDGKWKLFYSFPIYFLAMALNIFLLKFMNKLIRRG